MRKSMVPTGALAALILSSLTVMAQAPHAVSHERVLEPPAPSPRAESVAPGDDGPAARAAADFLARRGGQWEFSFDPRTGFARMVQGSGVVLIPGRGNALGAEALAGLPVADGDVTIETVEPLVERFLAEHRALVGPPRGRLVLDRGASLVRADGRLISLNYDWTIDGVPVEGARVFVRLNSGNITQFGAPGVGATAVDPVPAVDVAAARQALLAYTGDGELARFRGEPELLIQQEQAGDAIGYRLVWRFEYKLPETVETWEGRVDARSGDVVGFRDVNRYGRVRGGVYPRTVIDTEITAPMAHATVVVDGSTVVAADAAGAFLYQGGQARSGLDGTYFTTSCADGCTNPGQAEITRSVGVGDFDFGFGGLDGTGNGSATRAERNAFYHLNQVRRVARQWLPSLGWLDSNVGVNVNINATCNAFWDGTANFYRSGGGCNNTGEISDVIYHEWGHGIDGNTQGGDGATGEGTADVVSISMTHGARIGPYFQTDGDPVRDVDKNRTAKGLLTRSNVTSKCPAGSGPLGRAVHCEGEIYGQTHWDLSQALVAKHGHHTGWRTLERVFFTALPDSGSYLNDGTMPIYDAYINADDDDGNLANGTPNGAEIFAAFDEHEIAGTPRSSSAQCLRPDQPALTATPDCDSVALSWNSIVGVDAYKVLRNELREDTAFVEIASLAPGQTSFDDTEVAPSTDYRYVVVAVAPDGCESTLEAPVLARLDAQPILTLSAALADDTPRGNRSGFPDPGEEVDLGLTLANVGDLGAATIAGTLTAVTPGVTVLDGTDSWPDLGAGASAGNASILRFETDDAQVACGERIRFRLDVTSDSSCVAEPSYLDVTLGERDLVYVDDFEIDQGWLWDAGASTASAGHWVYGDPDGTAYQPEDDTTPDPGRFCWFTATNGGGAGVDDVDDGVTVLVSPTIDLSSLSEALLSYDRWFANRDLGEDPNDFFTADVSSDDGASWVNLETLGSNETAPSWVRREFKLQDFIPLTNQVRIRFQASDGAGVDLGNLIEAAVDEVRIETPVCDDTPACFVEPDFDGLATADPGPSCAEASLSWLTASSNCLNATISYNVYRSTDPAFVPSAATLIASNVGGTSFKDTLLDPGQTYHYIVRAYDSRSGEDSNLVRHTVVSPAGGDLEPPVFAGVDSAASGAQCGETVLGWAAAQETCSGPVAYEVYRSTDPGFVPGPGNRIGSTLSLQFVDAALVPGTGYTYLVRSRDEVGNEDGNDVRFTVAAGILDAILLEQEFEPDAGGWSVVAPNDAGTGNWEWGDPEGTSYQPEDDFTPDPGTNAWITGLASGGGGGGNDIDGGTTTLLSSQYDLSAAVDPVVRYARWFTNDRGGSPGEDPFTVEVSNDDGGSWTQLEQVSGGTPLAWVEVELPLAGVIAPTSQMRFRFTALDAGAGGSLVEAGIDGFDLLDRDQGCNGCAVPVDPVGTIFVDRVGNDVVLDWTADPAPGTRFAVYKLGGAAFGEAVRIGTSDGRTFVHEGAALSGEDFYYKVSAIDACGNESAL